MGTEYDSIALYKIHKKECEQHILMDMTKIFDIEDMLYASIWKVYCQAIDNNIPNEKKEIMFII
jgi:hypothetical protein